MNTRLSQIFALIVALILVACGPSPAEQALTSTQRAANIFATLTAQVPTATPTATPSPTSTATPTATATPTTTPTPSATATITLIPWPTMLPGANPDLDQAVEALRHIENPESLWGEKGKAVDEAFNVINSAGTEGAQRLKGELTAIQESGEKDEYFKLLAASLLFDIGGLDEVESIVNIWTSIPKDEWYYLWLFIPAKSAAATHDPRAAPLLKVLLSDKEGKPWPALGYPLTHECLWGAYGSVGLPVLHEVLKTSENPVEIDSTINLLAQASTCRLYPRSARQ